MKFKANSFSGNEPNHFFLKLGSSYRDLTFLSGLAHIGDSRGFAVLDFDNDGWLDLALVSTNKPLLKIYRNRMGELGRGGRRIKLKLVGRNDKPTASLEFSNRDAIGAKVQVHHQSGKTRVLQKALWQGNVAQNSELIWIGFEESDPVKSVAVLWPSGKTSNVSNPETSKTIVVQE